MEAQEYLKTKQQVPICGLPSTRGRCDTIELTQRPDDFMNLRCVTKKQHWFCGVYPQIRHLIVL